MLRKYALFVGVAALGALVTSCGGGNNGGGDPTPTPTDTSTATPTPTPTAVVFNLMDEFATSSVNGNLAFAFFTPTAGGNETFNAGARINGGATIALDFAPELVSFRFPDLTEAVTFGATELVTNTATLRSYARTDETLQLELPDTSVLRVTYQQTQDFTRDTVPGRLRGRRVTLFFNPVTTTTAISADLTYTGSVQVAGGDPGVTLANAISSPNTTITVNATASTVTGTIQIFENINGTPTQVGTLTLNAPLSANGTFTASIADTTNNLVGTFAGSLAGPNREELFLIFSVSGDTAVSATDDRRYVGTFIGT